jgi:hypothetical protein
MGVVQKQFVVDIEKLKAEDINRLKNLYKEGEKHLKYYNESMSVFKYPERRVKTYDTVYYEQVMPIIIDIIRNYEELNSK